MRRVLLLPVLALALSACSASPEATLRGDVEDVIAAANSNDGEGVRQAVDDLLGTIREQVATNELDGTRAARLRELALAVQSSADLLDPVDEPSPSPTPSEEPSPTPSPTPSEEPSPSPSPTEEEEPSPSPTEQEPEPSEEPSIVVPITPSASSQPSPASAASSPEPAASPVSSPTTS